MTGDPWRARGAYQSLQDRKRRQEQRERFNREQVEAEAATAAREQERQPTRYAAPGASNLGTGGYTPGGATEPAEAPPKARVSGLRAPLGCLTAIGVIITLTALYAVIDVGGEALPFLIGAVVLTYALFRWSRSLRKKELVAQEVAPSPQVVAAGDEGLIGEARGIQRRMEEQGMGNVEVLTFRVERYDARGNRLTPVQVQMRGARYVGSIQEGDQVRVSGQRNRQGLLVAKRIENLTTRSQVKTKGGGIGKYWPDLLVVAIIVIIIIAALLS